MSMKRIVKMNTQIVEINDLISDMSYGGLNIDKTLNFGTGCLTEQQFTSVRTILACKHCHIQKRYQIEMCKDLKKPNCDYQFYSLKRITEVPKNDFCPSHYRLCYNMIVEATIDEVDDKCWGVKSYLRIVFNKQIIDCTDDEVFSKSDKMSTPPRKNTSKRTKCIKFRPCISVPKKSCIKLEPLKNPKSVRFSTNSDQICRLITYASAAKIIRRDKTNMLDAARRRMENFRMKMTK